MPPRDRQPLAPIRQRSAADRVVDVLVDAIRGGRYDVGERLPPEHELAATLGVSRPVLREALDVLRRAGVVTIRRGAAGGAFVASLANISAVVAAGRAGADEALPLLEARRALELAAALLAVERASDAELRELQRLADALPGLVDAPEEFFEVDLRFHLYLGEISGNPVLSEFHRSTMHRLSVLVAVAAPRDATIHEWYARQQDLSAAVASREPERVVAALDRHLAPMEEHLLGESIGFACGVPV